MAKRIHRTRQKLLSRSVFIGLTGLILIVLLMGFVIETRIAIARQAHGPPGAEHPYDWAAWGCLSGALIVLAVLFLSRPAPRRWRKTISGGAQNTLTRSTKAVKRRLRSGYNRAK